MPRQAKRVVGRGLDTGLIYLFFEFLIIVFFVVFVLGGVIDNGNSTILV